MYPIIKEVDFRREIKSDPRTCYLFFGEEDYLKNAAVRTAYTALCGDPAFDIFNYTVMDGREFDADRLLDALAPPPMAAERKLIVLQSMDFTSIKQAELSALCSVLAALADYDYNTLIITTAADGFDPGNLAKNKPSAQFKELTEFAVPVQFEHPTPAKLAAWAQKHFAAHGAQASPEVAQQTVNYCGRDMFTLAGEIEKIACYALAAGRDTVQVSDITTAGIPATEYGTYAFANAITEGRRADALAILDDFRFRRIEPVIILGEVSTVYSTMLSVKLLSVKGYSAPEIAAELKMNEYKLAIYQKSLRNVPLSRIYDIIRAAMQADYELKSGAKGYAPLEKLICS